MPEPLEELVSQILTFSPDESFEVEECIIIINSFHKKEAGERQSQIRRKKPKSQCSFKGSQRMRPK